MKITRLRSRNSVHYRISQRLARRIKELAERYDSPMPAMNAQVDELEMKVNGHLEKMGFELT